MHTGNLPTVFTVYSTVQTHDGLQADILIYQTVFSDKYYTSALNLSVTEDAVAKIVP